MKDYINTSRDIEIKALGWTASETHRGPTVFLFLGRYPLSSETTMSPDEARAVANLLLKAADKAEQAKEQAPAEEAA